MDALPYDEMWAGTSSWMKFALTHQTFSSYCLYGVDQTHLVGQVTQAVTSINTLPPWRHTLFGLDKDTFITKSDNVPLTSHKDGKLHFSDHLFKIPDVYFVPEEEYDLENQNSIQRLAYQKIDMFYFPEMIIDRWYFDMDKEKLLDFYKFQSDASKNSSKGTDNVNFTYLAEFWKKYYRL